MAVVAQHEHEAIRTRIKAALAAATCAVDPIGGLLICERRLGLSEGMRRLGAASSAAYVVRTLFIGKTVTSRNSHVWHNVNA